jgi:hypothetical protein
MKPNVILTTSSLVTILLVTFHLTDDIVWQMEPNATTQSSAHRCRERPN